MKILWITHEAHLSGANICLLEYLDILQAAGYEQQVVVPANGEMVQKFIERNISVKTIPYYGWAVPAGSHDSTLIRLRKSLRNKLAIQQIASLAKKSDADFIVTNTIVVPVGAFAAKKAKKRHIWFIHEFGEEDHGFTIANKFSIGAKLIDKLSEKVVFNSLAIKKKFEPFVSEQKMYIVTNPVNFDMGKGVISSPVRDVFKLIMIGQIAVSKNQLDAIKGFVICRNRGLNAELTIVGKAEDKKYSDEITDIITKNGLEKYVHFTGSVKHPVTQLLQSHALLMCSRMEAFGRVTVEALKCGIPVIAANKGGSLEIIEDGINGYFYNSEEPENLAATILKLYNTYHCFDKEKMSVAARAKFNDHNSAIQLKKIFC
jgi:glycosyltransferase involved in cell wall biosynthesis